MARPAAGRQFRTCPAQLALVDPAGEAWYQHAARLLDRGVDFIVGAPPVDRYAEPADPSAANWPEVVRARAAGSTQVYLRYAPDRTRC
jgi:two-component system sensor histidine kinase ChvG